ncbi:hypothetical protein [Methylocystis echinoides]|jgi:hypothetical protein|uniref:Uncharacterized protein n=1 Tax=Methylocystis echinoides TaxID=29468 RepID=A0A9W6GRA8_9HYPH|nr:hypothetical protein [Methylocystis echinoides]GLI91425.1 hypothetical protein LMG27198_04170 [Methylocystis echinoides]
MRKSQNDRDPIKEFIRSIAPRLERLTSGEAKSGLPARNRPGFSQETRSRHARRVDTVLGTS